MKLKVFEVVELLDGNKATILENNKNRYKAEIVNKYGESQGTKYITETDIKKILISNNKITLTKDGIKMQK